VRREPGAITRSAGEIEADEAEDSMSFTDDEGPEGGEAQYDEGPEGGEPQYVVS
jgi:hypothetical protein